MEAAQALVGMSECLVVRRMIKESGVMAEDGSMLGGREEEIEKDLGLHQTNRENRDKFELAP